MSIRADISAHHVSSTADISALQVQTSTEFSVNRREHAVTHVLVSL